MDYAIALGLGCALFFLFVLWVVSTLAGMERRLETERDRRRELSKELTDHKWEAFDVYRELGLERKPCEPAKWAKKD